MAQHSQNNWVGLQHDGFFPLAVKLCLCSMLPQLKWACSCVLFRQLLWGCCFFVQTNCLYWFKGVWFLTLFRAHVLLTKTPPGCPAARCHVRSGKFSRFACFLTCFHQSGASAAETSFLLVYTPSFLPHYSSFYWADFVMNGSALEV